MPLPERHTELAIDVETYSSNSIKFGAEKYADAPDFEILIISYQFFETVKQKDPTLPEGVSWSIVPNSEQPICTMDLLNDGMSKPSSLDQLKEFYADTEHLKFWNALVDPSVTKTAYNAKFERTTLRKLTGQQMPANQWKDTMILAASLGLPRSLAAVGNALNLKEEDKKMKEGKSLIHYFSLPYTDRKTGKQCRHIPTPDNAEDWKKWQTYLEYNKQDVQTEHTILKTLIRFRPNDNEEKLWQLDQKINDRGVCLDIPMAKNIVNFEAKESEKKLNEARAITGLSNPNSVPQLLEWLTHSVQPRDLFYCINSLDVNQLRQILQMNQQSKTNKLSPDLQRFLLTYIRFPKLKGIPIHDKNDPNVELYGPHSLKEIENFHPAKPSGNLKRLKKLLAGITKNALQNCGRAEIGLIDDPDVADCFTALAPKIHSVNPDMDSLEALINNYVPDTIDWSLEDIQDIADNEALNDNPEYEKDYKLYNNFIDFYNSLRLPLDFSARREGYSKADPSEDAILYPTEYRNELQKFLEANGKIVIENLSKATVAELLDRFHDDPDMTDICTVLQLRQALSKTSIKKYQTMIDTATYDPQKGEYRAHDLIQFYGARTGRFSGAIIQPQNLARNTVPDEVLDKAHHLVQTNQLDALKSDEFKETPETLLSQLVRTAFIPSPGHTFIVSDFSAIEARALSFIAGVDWRINAFKEGKDIYCESASKIFGKPVVKHGVNGELRAQGKVAELACGYGGGVGAMKRMDFAHVIDNDKKYQDIVNSWRKESPEIPQMWSDFEKAAKDAVANATSPKKYNIPFYVYQSNQNTNQPVSSKSEDSQRVYGTSTGAKYKNKGFYFYITSIPVPDSEGHAETKILRMHLPSGRCMSYWDPCDDTENKFGEKSLSFMVQNQTTRKWERQEWWGGTFVENAVQAYCRDLLCIKMAKVESNPAYNVVFHIHDEMVVDVPAAQEKQAFQDIDNIMSESVDWASDCQLLNNKVYTLPLKGGTYQCDFYRKD